MEKEEGFQFQTSQVMNGKTGIPRVKKQTLVRCSANPMILILMRVSLPSRLRKTAATRKRERETHTYTLTQSVLMQYYGKLQ